MQIFVTLLIGALVGWLAGKIMHSRGGLLKNILVGLVGGALGGWLGSLIGVNATGWAPPRSKRWRHGWQSYIAPKKQIFCARRLCCTILPKNGRSKNIAPFARLTAFA